jgi:hypothetical protein
MLTAGSMSWLFIVCGTIFGSLAEARAETIELNFPVACEVGRTCFIQNYVDADPSPAARDYGCGTLTYNNHNGTDFRALSRQSNIKVVAAADGRVLRVRDEMPDGSFRASGRDAVKDVECGNGVIVAHADQWETQYCHLAKGSLRVKPGDQVRGGDELGQIGLSGLTEFPHLHLTVRHQGKIVDPFAYGAAPGCGAGTSLWAPSLRAQLAYRERSILNAGFAGRPVTMELIEEGKADDEQLTADTPALVAFIRSIGLRAGDVQMLTLKNPKGATIAENRVALEKDKAQSLLFTGRKRPEPGWDKGSYIATFVVERDGRTVLQKSFEIALTD